MYLKLKCRIIKKNNNKKIYFIDVKSKSKSKSWWISNPSLFKMTQTKNFKIKGFQIKAFKSINGFQIQIQIQMVSSKHNLNPLVALYFKWNFLMNMCAQFQIFTFHDEFTTSTNFYDISSCYFSNIFFEHFI